MAQLDKLIDIGIVVASFGIGLLFLYLFIDQSKEAKKKVFDEIISQLINLILFIWLGKIVFNIKLFTTDPLAVLAYPSDSNAFYFAVIATALGIFYKAKKKNFAVFPFLHAFLYVFLAAAFVFEFIQLTFENNHYAFYSFLLYFILFVLLFAVKEKLTSFNLFIVLFSAWSLGMLLLTIMQPFVTIFGFTMHAWFMIVFYLFGMAGLLYKRKKCKQNH